MNPVVLMDFLLGPMVLGDLRMRFLCTSAEPVQYSQRRPCWGTVTKEYIATDPKSLLEGLSPKTVPSKKWLTSCLGPG